MDYLAKRVKKRYGLKTGSGVEETKSNEPTPHHPTPENIDFTPPPPTHKSPKISLDDMKKKVEVLKAKSRPTSPISQTKKQLNYNEDSSDDEKTVNNDTITVADELKPIYLKAQKYLKTLENEKNSYNLHNNNKAAYEKLNKYMTEITGKPSDFKKLKTFREKLLVNFS